MKLLEEVKNIKSGEKELRSFGHVVGGIFSALGLLFLWKGQSFYPYFLGIGMPLIILGFLRPRLLKQVYIAWMSLAILMGAVMAPIVLTLLYFITVTPIAVIARLTGKKFLDLDFRKKTDTYWIPKDNSKRDKKSYEVQF